MKLLIGTLSLLLYLDASSWAQEVKKDFIEPRPQEATSMAVKTRGGTMLFLAGHTASLPQVDADHGNFDAQARRSFDKIKNTLAKAGGGLDDIVSMSVFMTDLRYVPDYVRLAKELFKKGLPATTFVEVSHLARPQLLVEIQPVAVTP